MNSYLGLAVACPEYFTRRPSSSSLPNGKTDDDATGLAPRNATEKQQPHDTDVVPPKA